MVKGKSVRQFLAKFIFYACAFTFYISPFTLDASSLELVSVTPSKIFTPNGDGCNDIITFRLRTTAGGAEIRGRIFNLKREVVAELKPISLLGSPSFRSDCVLPDTSPGSYFWDGKDVNGNLAPKGIYVYQIENADKAIRGTVVVAR